MTVLAGSEFIIVIESGKGRMAVVEWN